MSSGKGTEFFVSEGCGVVWKGDRVFRVRVRGVWCLTERRLSFLRMCPRGVVSYGKETEFSESVSEGCGVFWKGDRVF